ncbi:unnamed protein product, partial [marine sediment metagenome]
AELQLAVVGKANNIDSLKSEAFLSTNVDGNVAGMKASSTSSETKLSFIGANVEFLRQDASKAIFWDINLGEYTFDGKVVARSGAIGGWTITSTLIHSGVSTALDADGYKATTGLILNSDGSLQTPSLQLNSDGSAKFKGTFYAENMVGEQASGSA